MPDLLARFSKSAAAAHLTDRAVHDAFVTAFAAAGVPLRLSQARSPKPHLAALAPLPAGVTSDCEVLLAAVDGSAEVDSLADRVNAHLPAGLRIGAVWALRPGQSPPAPEQFATAEYAVQPSHGVTESALHDRVEAFLAAARVPIPRRPAPEAPVVDARALAQAVRVASHDGAPAIVARLPLGGADSLHPRQFAAALGFTDGDAVRIHRLGFSSDAPTEFRPFPLHRRLPDGQ